MRDRFDQLAERWPSAFVARAEVKQFTGGIMSGKTLANLAAKGETVPPAFRVGRKMAYEVRHLVDFLRRRSRGAK